MDSDSRLHALANSLVTNRLFSIDALEEYAERGQAHAQENDTPEPVAETDFDYLCARFIQWSSKHDAKSFGALVNLANLGIVTQLANFFHQRTDGIEKSGSPTIILDGPFLIDFIGLNGEVRRSDAALMIEAATEKGSRVWVFRHSILEAIDIVKAVVKSDAGERYGPLAIALRNKEVSLEALEAFISDPYGIVRRLAAVDKIFDIDGKNNRWEEDDFRDVDWQAAYAALMGWKDLARKRDCDSVLGVMRLRAGHLSRSPWDSQFFLLTSNAGLARLLKQACVAQGLMDSDQIGPAISRSEFAAILWLAGSLENRHEAVTSHLLAAAKGVLSRDRGLIKRVHQYAMNLNGSRKELVEAIVQTEFSYEMLQDVTLGNSRRVTDDAFDRVIDNLIAHGKEEGVQEATAEESRARRRLREEAATAKAAKEAAEAEAVRAVGQAQTAEQERQETEARALAAESAQIKSEAERQHLAQMAGVQLATIEKAQDVIRNIISGSERDWSRVGLWIYRTTAFLLYLILGVLAGFILLIGWIIRQQEAGIVLAVLFVLGGIIAVLNDTMKARTKTLLDNIARKCTLAVLGKDIGRLEKRLGVRTGGVIVVVERGSVRIAGVDNLMAS